MQKSESYTSIVTHLAFRQSRKIKQEKATVVDSKFLENHRLGSASGVDFAYNPLGPHSPSAHLDFHHAIITHDPTSNSRVRPIIGILETSSIIQ